MSPEVSPPPGVLGIPILVFFSAKVRVPQRKRAAGAFGSPGTILAAPPAPLFFPRSVRSMPFAPSTRLVLEGFRSRLWRMHLLQALLAMGGALLWGSMLVGGIDRMVFLSPEWRWGLWSGLVLGTLALGWYRGGRRFWGIPSAVPLARMIEARVPSPHGVFLAAVEIGSRAQGDSEEFSGRVQDAAEQHAARLNLHELVSLREIRVEALVLGMGGAVLLLVLSCVEPHFGSFLARALLPFGPIERITRCRIEVLEPTAREGFVPQGEPIAVRVRVQEGASHPIPSLSLIGAGGRKDMVLGGTSNRGEFLANLETNAGAFEFQIRAGDAQTARFRIQPVARPRAVRFQKEIVLPEYLESPAPVVMTDETDGEVRAVAGSRVKLAIRVDQPVSGARLHLWEGQEETLAPLELAKDGLSLGAEVRVLVAGSYALELTAARTGFESAPGPRYGVVPLEDRPPGVRCESPRERTMTGPGEKVLFRGRMEDDWGLRSVGVAFQSGGGDWQERLDSAGNRKEVSYEREWDPGESGARPGEVLRVKLVALDFKGQRGESPEVRIVMALPGSSGETLLQRAAHRSLVGGIQALQRELNEAERSASEWRSQTQSRSPDLIRQEQAFQNAKRAVAQAQQRMGEIREQMLRQRAEEGDRAVVERLGTVLQSLGRIHGGLLDLASDGLAEAARMRGDDQAETQRMVAESLQRAVQRAALAEEALRAQLAVLENGILGEQLRELSKSAGADSSAPPAPVALLDRPAPAAETLPNERDYHSLGAVLKEVSEMAAHARGASQNKVRSLRDELRRVQSRVSKGASSGASEEEAWVSGVRRAARAVEDWHPEMEREAEQAVEAVQRDLTRPSQRLEQASRELEALRRQGGLSRETQETLSGLRLGAEASVTQAESTLASTLREGMEPQASASEMATAARALRSALRGEARGGTLAETAQSVSKALRPLETASRLAQAAAYAERLGNEEGLESPPPRAAAALQRALGASLRKLAAEVDSSGFGKESVQKIKKALTEAPSAGEGKPLLPAQAQRLAEALREVSEEASETVAEARRALENLAPGAAQEMESLAGLLKTAAQKNGRLVSALEGAEREAAAEGGDAGGKAGMAGMKSPASEARGLERQVEGVREGLLQRANQEDLGSSEGRLRARDAEATAAGLRGQPSAGEALRKAAAAGKNPARADLLKQAAQTQEKLANQLARASEWMESQQSGDREKLAQAREAIRRSEKEIGMARSLDAREERASAMERLGQVSAEEAKQALRAMLAKSEQGGASAAEKKAMQRALQALGDGAAESGQPGVPPAAAQAIQAATQAGEAAQRADRAAQAASANDGTGNLGSAGSPASMAVAPGGSGLPVVEGALPPVGTPGKTAWGMLPRQTAADLMEGGRERVGGEYQASIDAYFRALGERARQGNSPR
jgi:hypothetical protein